MILSFISKRIIILYALSNAYTANTKYATSADTTTPNIFSDNTLPTPVET